MKLHPDNTALPMSPSIAAPPIKIEIPTTTGEILKPFNDIFPSFFGNVMILKYFIQYRLNVNIIEKLIK